MLVKSMQRTFYRTAGATTFVTDGQMSLKCIIIEDTQDQLQLLESYIKRTPGVRLVSSFDSGTRNIKQADESRIDILFLNTHSKLIHDLNMNLLIRKARYTLFILNKKPQHILLNNEPVGYLTRPLSYNGFIEAVKSAETFIDKNPTPQHKNSAKQPTEYEDSFFIRTDSQYVRVKYDTVLYVEAMRDFAKVYTSDRCYTVLVNLKNLEAQLPANDFFRSHRSYMVNLTKVDSIESDTIHIGKHAVPLGVAYRDELIQKVTRKLIIRQHP